MGRGRHTVTAALAHRAGRAVPRTGGRDRHAGPARCGAPRDAGGDVGRSAGVEQAAVVARYVPTAYSAQACELAELATVPQLRRSLSRYAFVDEPTAPTQAVSDPPGQPVAADDGDDEAPAPGPETEPARLSMSTVDGRFELSYSAPASIGAVVESAIREAKDALFHAGNVDATLADGLADVANRSLSAVEGHREPASSASTSISTPMAVGSGAAVGSQPTWSTA